MSASNTRNDLAGALWGLAMVFSGTFATILMKIQYSSVSEGIETCIDPVTKEETNKCPFQKPWFGVLQMKLAMSMCLIYLYIRKKLKNTNYLETPLFLKWSRMTLSRVKPPTISKTQNNTKDFERQPLLSNEKLKVSAKPTFNTLIALAVPSFFDLLQTVLCNIGLLFISSSVYQMARGFVIVFSAILSVKYMGKKLYMYHYVSILIVCLAICMVGIAGVNSAKTTTSLVSSSNQILGLFFILLAQLFCAIQIVIEEHVMTSLNVSPVLLVGMEGLWGLFFFLFLSPILTFTPHGTSSLSSVWHEDFLDTVIKIYHSSTILWLNMLYILAVGILNVAASNVTKLLNAVIRSILEALRTLGVWLVGLVLYYGLRWTSSSSPGEAWTAMSWVELAGFILMMYGTFVYKKLVLLPFYFLYAEEARKTSTSLYQSPFMASMH